MQSGYNIVSFNCLAESIYKSEYLSEGFSSDCSLEKHFFQGSKSSEDETDERQQHSAPFDGGRLLLASVALGLTPRAADLLLSEAASEGSQEGCGGLAATNAKLLSSELVCAIGEGRAPEELEVSLSWEGALDESRGGSQRQEYARL